MKTKRIKLLKKYFKKEKFVVLAFLFGSFTKGRQTKESDLDVAVYFKNYPCFYSSFSALFKPKRIRDLERKIWLKLTKLLDENIDLVCLNETPASLITEVLENGIPLKIDKKFYWKFYLEKSLETEDYLGFLKDFEKISEKARSLSLAAKTRITERFEFLKEEMTELEGFRNLTLEEYVEDKVKRRNIERWTECMVNALIDITKVILASEKKKIPKSYGDALFHFGLLMGLKKSKTEAFSELAGLRNILAHEYLEILYGRIKNFIEVFPEFYEKICQFLQKYL